MRTIAARAATALAVAATCLAPTQADAARACVNNFKITFAPALTVEDHMGTATIDFQVQCPELPGHPGIQYSGRSEGIGYFGSCAAVIFADGTRTVMVGTRLYLFVADYGAKALIVEPSQPCTPGTSVSSVQGSGVEIAYP